MTAAARTLPIEFVRQQFPSLKSCWVFMDNAGGSQILKPVIDRVNEYWLTSNVQLGASYEVSQLATTRLNSATQQAATFINASDPSEVVMGPSTSLLLRILALSYGQILSPGDEVIVTNCDHEANITPWKELQRQGITIKVWQLNPDSLTLELDDLAPLMTERTKLVTLVHASNVTGTIHPVRAIADFVHARGAHLCVDGVGYAPHRLIDVQALGVDFYVFSFYKVYGPHQAMLYGRRDLLLQLPGFNHDFIGQDAIPYKLQPGGPNYELSYGTLGISDYFQDLAQQIAAHSPDTQTKTTSRSPLQTALQTAFEAISVHEERLSHRLLTFLGSQAGVQIIGDPSSHRERRVPTLSFIVEGVNSATIPPQTDARQIGIRYGDFYAKHLIQDLGLSTQNGVVRISLVHYNTLEECDSLIRCLEKIIQTARTEVQA